MVWVVLRKWREDLICCCLWIVLNTGMHLREPRSVPSAETKGFRNLGVAKLAQGKCPHHLRGRPICQLPEHLWYARAQLSVRQVTRGRKQRESPLDSDPELEHSCGGDKNDTVSQYGEFFEMHPWDHPSLLAPQLMEEPCFRPSSAAAAGRWVLTDPLAPFQHTQQTPKGWSRVSVPPRPGVGGCVCPRPWGRPFLLAEVPHSPLDSLKLRARPRSLEREMKEPARSADNSAWRPEDVPGLFKPTSRTTRTHAQTLPDCWVCFYLEKQPCCHSGSAGMKADVAHHARAPLLPAPATMPTSPRGPSPRSLRSTRPSRAFRVPGCSRGVPPGLSARPGHPWIHGEQSSLRGKLKAVALL